jgi:hypothetical protein
MLTINHRTDLTQLDSLLPIGPRAGVIYSRLSQLGPAPHNWHMAGPDYMIDAVTREAANTIFIVPSLCRS